MPAPGGAPAGAPAGAPGGALDAPAALAVAGCAVAGFVAVAVIAPPAFALVAAQLALAGVAVALARAWTASPRAARAALGLAPPRARFVAAAVLIGGSAWYLNLSLVDWLGIHGAAEVARLEDLVTAPPLAVVLVTLAAVPAVCEELVFRGVVARGLATRLPAPVAALASAAMFSLYHLSVIQALPTFVLGTLLAMIALRGGSILPTMLAHAINNAMAIVLTRPELGGAAEWLDGHGGATTAACGVACGAGVALAAWPARGAPA